MSQSPRKRARVESQLDQLKRYTSVVADTGEFAKIQEFKPDDATTNPSLILQAVSGNAKLLEEAIAKVKKRAGATKEELVEETIDELSVAIGLEILKVIPGRISTEVDAKYSFDAEKSVEKAKKIIAMYEEAGIPKNRILIKLATTWEGVKACKKLQKELHIDCNMTLLFSFVQAVAAAEAGAFLISPFVGRILDWHVKNNPAGVADEDPGVVSVREIFNYYKTHDYKTVVMGASFRNKQEILALAGCDKLTIAPKFLEELANSHDPVERTLSVENAKRLSPKKLPKPLDESTFRWMLNEDPMATEKLAEGIRNFEKDTEKLRALIRAKL